MRGARALVAYMAMGLFVYAFGLWVISHGPFVWSGDKMGPGPRAINIVRVDVVFPLELFALGLVGVAAILLIGNGVLRLSSRRPST